MVQHPFEISECAGGWWFQRFEMGAHLRCTSRIGEGCIPKQGIEKREASPICPFALSFPRQRPAPRSGVAGAKKESCPLVRRTRVVERTRLRD